MPHASRILTTLACCALPLATHAAVTSSGAGGFSVREEVQFAGNSAAAWKHLVDVGSWWSPSHTYSGNSANLSLSLQPGGCWCEKLDQQGFARHMDVVLVIPMKTLRLTGGLGPLQGLGATGALTFTLREASPGATTVTAEYSAIGYSAQGFGSLAPVVDGVLAEQLKRFATK
jgi:hypothetical protein